jgi:hypothetical protein
MSRLISIVVIAVVVSLAVVSDAGASTSEAASSGAGSPSPTPTLKRSPDYRRCGSDRTVLAEVADLHRVSVRAACRVTKKLVSRVWPVSGWVKITPYCSNDLGHVHRFDGWNVKVRGFKYPATLSRHGRWFAFVGEEFPISCV